MKFKLSELLVFEVIFLVIRCLRCQNATDVDQNDLRQSGRSRRSLDGRSIIKIRRVFKN